MHLVSLLPSATWSAIATAAPDYVVVAPCGYHLPGGIVVRPGPRLLYGVEAIASILHPDSVPAASPGAGYRVAPPG